MAYAAEADLDAGWDANTINLVSVDDGATARNATRIAAALAFGSTQIDSYLSRRYPLPVAPTEAGAALLTSIAVDLAVGRLADSAGRMTDVIKARRDAAVQWLRDVAAAKADVPIVSGAAVPGAPAGPAISPAEAVIVAPPRLFTRASLREA